MRGALVIVQISANIVEEEGMMVVVEVNGRVSFLECFYWQVLRERTNFWRFWIFWKKKTKFECKTKIVVIFYIIYF